ncbi:MAG: dihydroorotate dehydrogenase, partial [Acidobacteriaceae bacterium]|nr:dihydroorotate dehydrogenase [Acidobacteriaceae bacterium]
IVKLSPNVSSIEPLAKAAEDSGADAVSLINTLISFAIDVKARKPRIGAGFGGLSGPGIKPLALRLVYEAARSVNIPVIGLGGIASGADAAEFLMAGASAVQVGTATFVDPRAPVLIANQLGRLLRETGKATVKELVGNLICRSIGCSGVQNSSR